METSHENWAEKFIIQTRLSKETRDTMKNKMITRKVRDEIIDALSTLILVHTIRPTPTDCEMVCRKLQWTLAYLALDYPAAWIIQSQNFGSRVCEKK